MELQEGGPSYEEIRKQRLEENKKRMQELGLADLSKTLAGSVSATKTTGQTRQVKPRIPKEFIELRRSSRVAANPAPDYREVDADSSLGRRSYSSRGSSLLNRKYASDESRLEAILEAETIMKELPRSSPCFVKPMLQSHVTGGFWLGLPSSFCKTYLPKKDDKLVLENEKGDEWETVYLANKTGLSGGWRGFSLDHGLVDGDALVFELVEPSRFKVHIIRASEEAQDDEEGVEEDSGDELDLKAEAEILVKEKGELETPQKSRGKKKKVLKQTVSQKGKSTKKKPTKVTKHSESESEESEKESENPGRSKDHNPCKRSLDEDEDIEDLFKIEEEEDNTTEPKSRSSQLTSYMRTGKPRYGRVAKKPMICGDVISVC